MRKTPDNKTDILMLTPHIPAESGHGASMRIGAHLEILARQYRVHLNIIRHDETNPIESDFITKYATSVKYWNVPRTNAPNSLITGLKDAITPLPRLVREYPIKLAEQISTSLPQKAKIEKVHVFRLGLAGVGERIAKNLGLHQSHLFVDMDDYESESAKRNLSLQQLSLGKVLSFFYKLDIKKLENFEKYIANKIGSIYLCSEVDKNKFLKRNPSTKIQIIPNVYRIPSKIIPKNKSADKKSILFIGSLNYKPNTDAIDYFINSIWTPYLKTKGYKFIIAGRLPHESLIKTCLKNEITLISNPPDIEPLYKDTDLLVVPIRTGGGTRIKILEAFGYGRPVVSTSIGAEGIDVCNGKQLMLADDPRSFSEACIKVLNDEELANRLIRSGRKLVEESYSLDSIVQCLLTGY